MFLKNERAFIDTIIFVLVGILFVSLIVAGIFFVVYYNKSTKDHELNLFSNPIEGVSQLSFYIENSESNEIYTDSAKFSKDTNIIFSTIPKQDFVFVNWSDSKNNVLSTSQTFSFKMPAKHTNIYANFKPISYKTLTLSLLTNSLDFGSVEGSGEYLPGDKITIKAIPTKKYVFDCWRDLQGNLVGSSSTHVFVMPGENYTLIANFRNKNELPPTTPYKFKLSLLLNPLGYGNVEGDGNYLAGETVRLRATPKGNYVFEKWTDSTGKVLSTASSFDLNMPANNYTVTANFKVKPSGGNNVNNPNTKYTLSLYSSPSSAGVVSGAGEYKSGEKVEINVSLAPGVPSTAYSFDYWIDSDGIIKSDKPSFSFYMPKKNYSLTAHYKSNTTQDYLLSLFVTPDNYGSVNGSDRYSADANVTITAIPAEATSEYTYVFEHWKDDDGNTVSENKTYNFKMPKKDYNLTAHFKQIPINQTYKLEINVFPLNTGSVDGAGDYVKNQIVNVTAIPEEGYEFEKWTNASGEVSRNQDYNFSMPDHNYSLTAHFKEKTAPQTHKLTLLPSPANAGSVSGDGIKEVGANITISATAYNGYVFEKWSDSLGEVSREAIYSFTMPDKDYNLTAHFKQQSTPPQKYKLSLTPSPSNAGKVTGAGKHTQGQKVTVSATPYANYVFKKWSDASGDVNYSSTYEFYMPAHDYSLTAHFEDAQTPPPQEYELSLTASPTNAGSVTGNGKYAPGTQVQITATPINQNYVFKEWKTLQGVFVSSSSSYIYTMPSNNVSLIAYFEETQTPPTPVPEFVSKWDTSMTKGASLPNNEVILPLVSGGIYNFVVDWGDNTTNYITKHNSSFKKHVYATPGVYEITITGTIRGFSFKDYDSESFKILDILEWGNLQLGNSGGYFKNAKNLNISATDILNLSNTYVLDSMFEGATSFNSSIENWDVSNVYSMESMFEGATSFNQHLNDWNVSNVINMKSMFRDASSFNKPLNKWDVSYVTDMSYMFEEASSFDQSLASWDVISVKYMINMLTNTSLSTSNYDLLLNSWVEKELQQNVIFDATPTKHSAAAYEKKALIITMYDWTITDGQQE